MKIATCAASPCSVHYISALQRWTLLAVLAFAATARAYDAGSDGDVPSVMDAGGTAEDPAQYTVGVVPDYVVDFTGLDFVAIGGSTSHNLLTIENGGNFLASTTLVGSSASNGVTVTGVGSLWQSGASYIGLSTSGNTVTISAGGQATGDQAVIGYGGSGNSGTVTGIGSTWAVTYLTVGGSAAGNSLTIEAGGLVTADQSYIGDSGSGNSVTVTGTGSTLTGNLLVVGASGSNNSLTIAAGGQVTGYQQTFIGSQGDNNNVTVTGSGSTWTGQTLLIGDRASGNSLDITAGGHVAMDYAIVGIGDASGSSLGSSNHATVTGSGSTWSLGTLALGSGASGNSLEIADGGQVTSQAGILGTAGSDNHVTVTGSGSVWTSGLVFVGSNGSGNSLNISAGGQVTGTQTYIGNGGGDNHATVTGSGSTLASDVLLVGSNGSGNSLDITAGGHVAGNYALVGSVDGSSSDPGSANRVTVTGSGSTWSLTTLILGGNASGNSLGISDGGQVTTQQGLIGFGGSENNVTVTGSGSTWTSSGDLALGYNGGSGNTLTIEDSGLFDLVGSGVSFGSDTTNGANALQLNGGYFAWAGDRTSQISSFVDGGNIYYWNSGSFVLATPADLASGAINSTYYPTGAAASAATGGLYTLTGGYTILTSASNLSVVHYTNGQPADANPYATNPPFSPLTLLLPSGTATQSGVLSGAGSVAKTGGGTLTLSATNTYTGPTTISAGTLRLAAVSSTSSYAIPSGSTLEVYVPDPLSEGAPRSFVAPGGTTTFTGNGTLRTTGPGTATTAGGTAVFALGSGALIDNSTDDPMGFGPLATKAGDDWSANLADLHVGYVFDGGGANVRVDEIAGIGSIYSGSDDPGYTAFTFGVDNGSSTFEGVLWDGMDGHPGSYVKAGSGSVTFGGPFNVYSGTTTIAGGTLRFANFDTLYGGDTGQWTAEKITVASGATAAFVTDGADAFNSPLLDLVIGLGTATGGFLPGSRIGIDTSTAFTYATGIADTNGGANSIGFVKLGAGTLTLSGPGTYTGPTTVESGTLKVNGSLGSTAVTVRSGAILGGGGIIGGPVTLESGSRISPGNSPGTFTTGSETWNGGGGYTWEINDATDAPGAKGTSYDWLNIAGTLTLNNTSGSKFTIYVTSLASGNTAGLTPHFVYGQTYTYTIVTATSPIAAFDADKFLINSSAFFNYPGHPENWSIALGEGGLSLDLTFTAIPEPSAYAIGIALLLGGVILLRRRRVA